MIRVHILTITGPGVRLAGMPPALGDMRADGHAVFRTDSPREASAFCRWLQPEAVILHWPGLSGRGPDFIRHMRQIRPDCWILAWVGDERQAREAMEAGASGYIAAGAETLPAARPGSYPEEARPHNDPGPHAETAPGPQPGTERPAGPPSPPEAFPGSTVPKPEPRRRDGPAPDRRQKPADAGPPKAGRPELSAASEPDSTAAADGGGEGVPGRTRAGGAEPPGSTMDRGGLTVNFKSRTVMKYGRPLSLTYLEFSLLAYVMARPGTVVTYEELLRRVWGYEHTEDASTVVKACMYRLRKKIGPGPGGRPYIINVRRVGYLFDHF